jgi:hypothetical protein
VQVASRIVQIWRGAFEDAEHDRDIADALGHRTGGIDRGRDHAVAAVGRPLV